MTGGVGGVGKCGWGGVGGGGEGGLYLTLHRHYQNDFCITIGSDESHFNVLVNCEWPRHGTASISHSL